MQLIESVNPSYQNLKQLAEEGAPIDVLIEKRKTRWWIRIYEKWPADAKYGEDGLKLDKCISWTELQLTDWPDVSRQSYQHWAFKRRHDAEKFITLFHLVWAM